MRFRFLGASDGHVTGSCTHFNFERKNTQFLVDCGLVQGEGYDVADNSKPFPFFPSEINFVLLTHAHQDHCGLIPRLYREGFTGRVICTKATARLATISLMDSVNHANGLYTEQDVKRIQFDYIDEREGFGFSRMLPIDTDLFASFSRASHILGATSITLGWINDEGEMHYMVMSGDLGCNTKENPYQPLLAGRQGVFSYPEAIVVESTYGGRVREKQFTDFDGRIAALKQIIQKEVFDKKSLLVVPAFSLQRTQEFLFDLHYVFTNHFATEELSQAPFEPLNPRYEGFQDNEWNHLLQQALMRAIETLPTDQANKWKNSIVKISDAGRENYSLIEGAEITISDVRKLVQEGRHFYPVDIVLDSPLAKKMSAVFRDELCRRQRKNPEKTVYRNRKFAERLGLEDEAQVDSVIKSVFQSDDGDNGAINIPLCVHTIRYESSFKTPRPSALQERGCILITGGGMCEGGPVVKHLGQVVAGKHPAAVLVTGYMAKGSLGDALLTISKAQDDGLPLPTESLKIGEKTVAPEDVTARVFNLSGYYSGHTDQEGLLDFVFNVIGDEKVQQDRKPAVVFLNHGQHAARKVLKETIEARVRSPKEGDRDIFSVELPDDRGLWYDLNVKQWLMPEPEAKTDALLRDLLLEQRKTNMLLQRLIEQKNINSGTLKSPRRTQ